MTQRDLDRAGDGLYALPLEEFVAARNDLAKRLKQAGDTEGASEVATLRKPTLVAWAVDQLAHTRRREVDLLLDAGKRLVDAQQASIRKGTRTELDAAQASLRKSVTELTEAAAAILGSRASASTLSRVAETLRTAATGAEGRELLARGRLVEELSDTGWDIVAALTPAPTKGRRPRPEPKPKPRTAAKQDTAAERARLAELERARAAAERRVAAARRKEEAASERLADAEAARRAAEDELAEVEREIEETRPPG